jgi:hypothetical protein
MRRASAGLVPADATPVALGAVVEANVLNTPLLPVTIFMAVISVLCPEDRQRRLSRPINLLIRT